MGENHVVEIVLAVVAIDFSILKVLKCVQDSIILIARRLSRFRVLRFR